MDRLQALAISPSGFVFDAANGATFTVNQPGRLILEGMQSGLGLQALVDRLVQAFYTGTSDLRRDVLAFVRNLKLQGLVDDSFQLED